MSDRRTVRNNIDAPLIQALENERRRFSEKVVDNYPGIKSYCDAIGKTHQALSHVMQHVESMLLDSIRKGLGTKCGLSMDALIFDGGLVRGEVTPEHIETVLEWMRDKTDGTNDPRVRNIEFELKVKPMVLCHGELDDFTEDQVADTETEAMMEEGAEIFLAA